MNVGHQACRGWSEEKRGAHINLRELWVTKVWLQGPPFVWDMGVQFNMDNVVAVRYNCDPCLSCLS